MSTRSFVEDWLGNKHSRSAASRQSVINDSFDKDELESLMGQMGDLNAAKKRLGSVAPNTGISLFGDDFFSLVKAVPKLVEQRDMRASHIINHSVMGEAMDMVEYDKLHRYSVADGISAALSAISMEPRLEEILDRLKTEQKAAEELEQQMEQYSLLEGSLEGSEGEGDAQEGLISQMESLRQEMLENADSIDEGLESNAPANSRSMQQGMKDALEGADTTENAAVAWGLGAGGLRRLPPEERLRLAEKLNSEKFRRIAKLFGPMNRLAFAEQSRKSYHAMDEIFDVEQGNDIKRMLASQLASLTHPALRVDFLRKFVDRQLLQYKLRGVEKVAKGGIILCDDNSASMSGGREIWAKAVGLCLLRIATKQKREYYGIHFGSINEIREYDFRNRGVGDSITIKSGNKEETVTYIDGVVDFAETFLSGGTDFVTPLSRSLDLLKEQYEKEGSVSGDIVFCTDGICGVPDDWMEAFKSEQARLGFRVWGIIIGGGSDSEPLATICDGRVFEISDLISGEDIKEIFRNL